jgi:hypothetical protein
MDVDAEWIEKSDVPPSLSKKIMALKVCRNRCLAHAASDTALDMATPVLRMFFALLEHGGSLHTENDDKLVHYSRTKGQANCIITAQRSKLVCDCKPLCLCYTFRQCQRLRVLSRTISFRLPLQYRSGLVLCGCAHTHPTCRTLATKFATNFCANLFLSPPINNYLLTSK